MVEQLTWLKCYNGWIQALEKSQAGKPRNMGLNLCKALATTHTALLGMSDKTVKTLWVRISQQSNMSDAVLSACYRPPDQEGEVEDNFIRKLEEASRLQALVHIWA